MEIDRIESSTGCARRAHSGGAGANSHWFLPPHSAPTAPKVPVTLGFVLCQLMRQAQLLKNFSGCRSSNSGRRLFLQHLPGVCTPCAPGADGVGLAAISCNCDQPPAQGPPAGPGRPSVFKFTCWLLQRLKLFTNFFTVPANATVDVELARQLTTCCSVPFPTSVETDLESTLAEAQR